MDGQTFSSCGKTTHGPLKTIFQVCNQRKVRQKLCNKMIRALTTVCTVSGRRRYQSGLDLFLWPCTQSQCGYLLKRAAVWQRRLRAKMHQLTKFAWHPNPTGANYPATQPAVEIQFHLFICWCFKWRFQRTERLFFQFSHLRFPLLTNWKFWTIKMKLPKSLQGYFDKYYWL